MGRLLPFKTLPPQRPLSGAKQTSNPLEILDLDFRYRPRAALRESAYVAQEEAMSSSAKTVNAPGRLVISEATRLRSSFRIRGGHQLGVC